jgi:hypothetical protein
MGAWKASIKSRGSGRFLGERCDVPRAGRREKGERHTTTTTTSFSLAEDSRAFVFSNNSRRVHVPAGGARLRSGRSEVVKTFAASSDPSPLSGGEPEPESNQGPGLIKALLNAPALAERYFQLKWWRKPLWYFITFSFAYFAANTISLSFGAKAVNDVVASVLVVVFYEAASRVVYRAKKRTVWHWLLHYFKLGAVVGFLMDSYKLGG